MFFDPADQLVCTTDAVGDHHITLFPAVVNRLVKRVHRSDCVARVFQIPCYGDVGAEHVGCLNVLTDTLLGRSQFNFVFAGRVANESAAEGRLSRAPRTENHNENLAHDFFFLFVRVEWAFFQLLMACISNSGVWQCSIFS